MTDERIVSALKKVGVPVRRLTYTGQDDAFITLQLISGEEEYYLWLPK